MRYFELTESRELRPITDFLLGSPVWARGGTVKMHPFSTTHKMETEVSTFVVDLTGLIFECMPLAPKLDGEISGMATVRGYGEDPPAVREAIKAAILRHRLN